MGKRKDDPTGQPVRPRSFGLRLLASAVAVALMAAIWFVQERADEPQPLRYTVEKGDTLYAIAKRYDVTIAHLREWNAIDGDLIEVGQELIVWPQLADAPATKGTRTTGGGERGRIRSGRVGGSAALTVDPGGSDLPLVMPRAEPCKEIGADAVEGGAPEDEPEFIAARGLETSQLRVAMNAFIPSLYRCAPEGGMPSGRLNLELTVGCNGLVSDVTVLDDGGLPSDMVGCVTETLKYADFPAHDMPDGYTFGYPLNFSG